MRYRRLKVERERKKRETQKPKPKPKPASTAPGEEVGEMTFGYEEEF